MRDIESAGQSFFDESGCFGDGRLLGRIITLWSETMEADTWAAFEEAGSCWHNPTADRFRATLPSTGNETDRAEAYRALRGRDPDVNVL